MNTAELAETLATAHGLTKTASKQIVDQIFSEIATAAVQGHEVAIPGFGKFKIKDVPAREGRNPATGETIQIAASKKLTFSVAKAIKDKLNG